jgi:hypothetical protein
MDDWARESHLKDKLGSAIYALATGAGPIKERLNIAYFALNGLGPEDFPTPQLGASLSAIRKRLTSVKAPAGGTGVAAALAEMSDEEAVQLAKDILHLRFDLRLEREGR